MSPRGKKKKETIIPQKDRKDENLLSLLDLKSMSSTSIIEVIFLAGLDNQSNELLQNIKTISKNYLDVTNTTFITYEDVLELFDTFESVGMPENIEIPLKNILNDFKSSLEKGYKLTSMMMAQLFKIKLIHLVYKNTMAIKERKNKIRTFEEELNVLTKECRNVDYMKSDKLRQSLSKPEILEIPQTKSKSKVVLTGDFKSRSKLDLQETDSIEDLVFDDDISKHITFFAFQGIDDPEILKYLSNNLNVLITAIVEIKLNTFQVPENAEDKMNNFWDKILNYLYGINRQESFENTMLMKYNNTNELDFNIIFQDIIEMVKNLWNIKLNHLYYIRHTKIVQVMDTNSVLSTDCLNYYEKLLQYLPKELISESIMFSSLLQEIVYQFGDNKVSKRNSITEFLAIQMNRIRGLERNNSSTSMILRNMIVNKEVSISNSSSTDQFLSYDSNVLEQIIKCYGANIGNLISNLSIDVWKNTLPFHFLDNFSVDDDIIHKHDRDPSSSAVKVDLEKMQHFMYIFLFGHFTEKTIVPSDPDIELAENLDVYSNLAFWERCQVVVNKSSSERINIAKNLYQPPLASFVYREKLSSDVLIQEVVKAFDEYQYVQRKYCPETEKYLISFSDQLDDFGINVRVFDEFLPTLVCLRDFCKYITIKKSDWLLNNQPPKYYRTEDEIDCFNKVASIEDEEYRRLLSSKLNDEDSKTELQEVIENSISFEDLMKDLKHYPTNKNLVKECAKYPKAELMNVFDIGTYFLSVMGATTTFVSHDGVKLIVDNTKFITENPKCTVRLTCRKNDIILHSNPYFLRNNYHFQIKLQDETILTFFINDTNEMITNNNFENTSQAQESTAPDIPNIKQMMVNLKTVKVAPITENVMNQQFVLNPTGDIRPLDFGTVVHKLDDVKNTNFYKIDNNPKLITPSKTTIEIPLINLIDRIASPINDNINNIATNEQTFSKRHISHFLKTSEPLKPTMDFRITLPNGLFLSCVPAVDGSEQIVEVKQEFLKANENDKIYEEEFRLFTRNGFILVKKIDGTIVIFKTSGDQIIFEKPDSADEIVAGSNLKRCHMMNKDDYRKKLIYLLNKKHGEDTCQSSRRANFRTKKGYIINNEILHMIKNFKIPYKKTSIMKFSGHKTCLEGNKITQKQEYFLSRECDYSTGEIYFERSDGFRSLFDKFGRHSVQFSDGTVITTFLHVKNELVDGFVYISLSTRYEHPNYISVGYDLDECLTVQLSNDVKLTRSQKEDCYKVGIDNDIKLNIDIKSVSFVKTCDNCFRKYKCDFNIAPLVSKKMQINDRFVYARDSYDKKMFVNFAGNCQRNNDFVNRLTNNCACNHVARNVYKKLFVFDRNFSGEHLWSERMVRIEKKNNVAGQINEGTSFSGKKVIKLTKNHYKKLGTRFINNSSRNNLLLSKYKQKSEPKVEYYSYRVLQEMINTDEIQAILEELNFCLKEKNITCHNFESVIGDILEGCGDVPSLRSYSGAELKEFHENELKRRQCRCSVARRSMQDKILIWREECKKYKEILRNKYIPSYFNSQFCQSLQD